MARSFFGKVVKVKPFTARKQTLNLYTVRRHFSLWSWQNSSERGVFFIMLLKYAIREFLSEKKTIENLSRATLEGYELLFSDFMSWTEKEGIKTIQEVTPRVLKNYFMYLAEERKNNPVSLNTKRKLMSVFFNFLISEGLLNGDNPVKQLKKAKEEKTLKTLTDEEVNSLIAWLKRQKRRNNSFYTVRDYTIFVTLLGTGMRLGELCNLKWEDIDFSSQRAKIFGKARKVETIPLNSKLLSELALWKEYSSDSLGKLPEYVFTNIKGERLGENGTKQVFKRLTNETGIKVSPHMLRHTFARKFIESGGDVSVLSKLLRHSSIKTTEIYLHYFSNTLKDMNEAHNPLNNLI